MFEEFESLNVLRVGMSVQCSVLWEKKFLQAINFSDGFVTSKNRIVNEAVTTQTCNNFETIQDYRGCKTLYRKRLLGN